MSGIGLGQPRTTGAAAPENDVAARGPGLGVLCRIGAIVAVIVIEEEIGIGHQHGIRPRRGKSEAGIGAGVRAVAYIDDTLENFFVSQFAGDPRQQGTDKRKAAKIANRPEHQIEVGMQDDPAPGNLRDEVIDHREVGGDMAFRQQFEGDRERRTRRHGRTEGHLEKRHPLGGLVCVERLVGEVFQAIGGVE